MPNQPHEPVANPKRRQPSDHNATHIASPSAQCESEPCPKSKIPALALVGNPGAGKSTLLNGFADCTAFKAGISLNSGLTTSLSEYHCEGISLYDTPGLSDVERKKQAGQELDKLLALDTPLKIAFVVTLESGRVRPDDSVTIELVLDAIKKDTDNKFGVIINQTSKRVRETIMKSPEEEAKIRRSLTGRHSTSYWCYVDTVADLLDESDGKLMTNDLVRFFCFLPETIEKGTHTVPIDTEGMDDKREKYSALIKEIEATNAEMLRRMVDQMNTQKAQYAAQHTELLQKLQAENAQYRSDVRYLQANGDGRVQNSNQQHRRLSGKVGPGMAAALGIAAIPAIISPSLAQAYKYMDETKNGNQHTDHDNRNATDEKPQSGLDGNEYVDGDPGREIEQNGEALDMHALNNITESNIDPNDIAGQQYNQEYTDVTAGTDLGCFEMCGEFGL